MEKAETRFGFAVQTPPIFQSMLEQIKRAIHVGLNECFGAQNGTIDMTLSSKMDHRKRFSCKKNFFYQSSVIDVPTNKNMVRVGAESFQVLQVSRVGKLV